MEVLLPPPRRPRSHVIAEESFRAFCDALPDNWVVREQRPDYAIDVQVQVFEGELATPVFFFAQLKATDSARYVDDELRYSFETDQLFHWCSFDAPVMLAVFDTATGTFHYDWVGRIFARTAFETIREWRLQNTATVALPHRLRRAEGGKVRAEAEHGLRGLGSHTSLARTFHIGVGGEDQLFRDKVVADLNRWMHGCGIDTIHATPNAVAPAALQICKGGAEIRARYLGVELTIKACDIGRNDGVTALARALTCALLALAGHRRQVVTLVEDLLRSGSLFGKEAVLEFLSTPVGMTLFARADRVLEGLEIAACLATSGEPNIALRLVAGCRTARTELIEQRARYVLGLLLTVATDNSTKAALHYNLANSLRSSGEHRTAIREYLAAAALFPDYADREYWWRELGGSLYASKRVRLAARAYRRALELEPDDKLIPALLADTLFARGRFHEAAELFLEHVRGNPSPSAEYLAKALLVPKLHSRFGDVQRQPARALELARRAYEDVDRDRQHAQLEQALHIDPLCGFAWWNFAQGEIERGADPALTWAAAALITPWDLEAVLNAVGSGLNADGAHDGLLALALLFEAARTHGEAIVVDNMAQRVSNSGDEARGAAERLVNTARRLFEPPPEHFVFRDYTDQRDPSATPG